jgi:hypothetical protein
MNVFYNQNSFEKVCLKLRFFGYRVELIVFRVKLMLFCVKLSESCVEVTSVRVELNVSCVNV